MRTNDVLIDDFEDIKILQQYLYMSENHFIDVTNSIGVILRIRMGDNLHYYCKNMNFSHVDEMAYSETMTNETMLAIIEQLKESPAIEFPNSFKSRWDEIKQICTANIVQNKINRRN